MTFRIDSVHCKTGSWQSEIKGLMDHGIYCRLGTDEKGCGLYLVERPEREQILPPERFAIPSGTEKMPEANRLLAEALNSIGWGPQVDHCGNIIL